MRDAAFGFIIFYAFVFCIGLAFYCGVNRGRYRD